jgi:dephospho-CoA kinase
MDRKELARMAFSSPRALAALEAITHPPIRRAIEARIRRARQDLVVLDAALLQETGADALCDQVWYVACPARERRRRARRGRGWSEAEHRAREARQWSCRRKRARADGVIDNGADEARARRDVRRALRGIERRS